MLPNSDLAHAVEIRTMWQSIDEVDRIRADTNDVKGHVWETIIEQTDALTRAG